MLEYLRAHRRAFDLLAAAACALLLAYAFFLQFRHGLDPCPLCIFQRVAVFALGVALLLAAAPPPAWRATRMLTTLLVALAALAGAGVAGRHLYIQSLPPDKVPVCGASLDYMMDVFPLGQVLRKVLTGSGECAKVDWTFLGLSMPGWVLIWVVLLGTLGVLANWPRRRG
jgi:disulfide bond formation protein DsbB